MGSDHFQNSEATDVAQREAFFEDEQEDPDKRKLSVGKIAFSLKMNSRFGKTNDEYVNFNHKYAELFVRYIRRDPTITTVWPLEPACYLKAFEAGPIVQTLMNTDEESARAQMLQEAEKKLGKELRAVVSLRHLNDPNYSPENRGVRRCGRDGWIWDWYDDGWENQPSTTRPNCPSEEAVRDLEELKDAVRAVVAQRVDFEEFRPERASLGGNEKDLTRTFIVIASPELSDCFRAGCDRQVKMLAESALDEVISEASLSATLAEVAATQAAHDAAPEASTALERWLLQEKWGEFWVGARIEPLSGCRNALWQAVPVLEGKKCGTQHLVNDAEGDPAECVRMAGQTSACSGRFVTIEGQTKCYCSCNQ